MSLEISFEAMGIKEVKNWTDRTRKNLEKGFEEGMYFLFTKSQDIVSEHVSTGRLGASGAVQISGLNGTLVWTVPHASYLQYGTKPHTIRPIRKKALRFKIDGVTHFRKKVEHPGTLPVPFAFDYSDFEENVKEANNRMLKYVLEEWEGLS